ncbi:hypothetical protein MMC22_004067 [Lobaria immixta]|nr:hypothetical protein [Lobaria immixta]
MALFNLVAKDPLAPIMHFSSFFSLPSIFFVLYFCKVTLAVPSGQGVSAWLEDPITCPADLPPNIPLGWLPPPQTLLQLCASKEEYPHNMLCACLGEVLVCGSSRFEALRPLISYCLDHCQCGPRTTVVRDQSAGEIGFESSSIFKDSRIKIIPAHHSRVRKPVRVSRPSESKPKRPKNRIGETRTCSGTCTSVNLGCTSQSPRECNCFAPPVGLFYWHQGDCGTRLPSKAKRDLAQQRYSHYLNATVRFASSYKAIAPSGPLPDRAAQLASGLLPSPCNASYVSFACSDSPDGIVHEPPQNWLGALLPQGATKLPPAPKIFLSIHGLEEGGSQVAMVAVD